MKKSSFITLVLGTVSGMLFAIGMCMALLPEWNAFKPGIVLGSVGLVLGLITIAVWRKMVGKERLKAISVSIAKNEIESMNDKPKSRLIFLYFERRWFYYGGFQS